MVKCECRYCHKEFEGKKESNVFLVSRSENFSKAFFMPIDLEDSNLGYTQRQITIQKIVDDIDNSYIKPLKKFKDFDEGWKFVKETNGEGLVIRNERNWYKVKLLKEVKVEIKEHEESKEKGTFVLTNGNRVSGTSRDFVKQFKELKEQGKIPMAEIEYCFLTESGSYFQPRLRRIFEKGEENE